MTFFLYEAAGEAEFVSASERAESFYVFILFYVVWIMVRGLWFIYITIQPWSIMLCSYLFRSVMVKTASERPVIGCSWDITRPRTRFLSFPVEVMPRKQLT